MTEEQAIMCIECGAIDTVKSTDERAVRWPAWEPGFIPNFCPACGGDAWATEPRAFIPGLIKEQP